MNIAGYGQIIFIILGILIFFVILDSLFFRRARIHDSTMKGKVNVYLKNLTETDKQNMESLYKLYSPRMSKLQFSLLCVGTSLSIDEPLIRLMKEVVFAKLKDSLALVEAIVLIEELLGIVVTNEVAEKIITFTGLIRITDDLLDKHD